MLITRLCCLLKHSYTSELAAGLPPTRRPLDQSACGGGDSPAAAPAVGGPASYRVHPAAGQSGRQGGHVLRRCRTGKTLGSFSNYVFCLYDILSPMARDT